VTTHLSADDILANARRLVPELWTRARETAELRRVPSDLAARIREAGVNRICFPESWGGAEMPLPQQIELMEVLAYGDPAAAWAAKINSDAGGFASLLDPTAARELFPSVDYGVAGQGGPTGRAVVVAGGYRVTGRWSFGSGSHSADVLMAGCLVVDDSGNPVAPERLMVLAPASGFQIEDTWYTHGLAGSGSHHYSTKDLFVPAHHIIPVQFGAAHFDGPLYRDPILVTLTTPTVGVVLGLMKRAIEVGCEQAQKKVISIPPPSRNLKDLPRAHTAIARAEMLYGAARSYVYDSINRYWDECSRGASASPEAIQKVALSRLNAVRAAPEVARLLLDMVGAPAVYDEVPLARLLRDGDTIRQHHANTDDFLELFGRARLAGAALGSPLG